MKFKNKLTKYLLIGVAVILFFALVILLGKWTESIQEKKELTEIREVLKDALNTYGERGLLEMAGVAVNDIYYSEDGVSVFTSDNGSWNYSVDELQNISVYQNASPAVVYISTGVSKGSGFFVSADGYICTNKHVIDDANYLLITTSEGNQYNATIVGVDEEIDIAVLKITSTDGSEFKYLEFDNSDLLIIGQKVLAIGNPFGYDRTMVPGIVSGLSRPIRNDNGTVLLGMIQTSAPIYPGNSGGPLLNAKGKVVGVCTSVYSQYEYGQGLNFVISSNAASSSVKDLIETGTVHRGWIDITPVTLTKQIADYASLKLSSGVLVSEVVANGKAQAAGIKGGTGKAVKYGDKGSFYIGGDVITSVNGYSVASISDLYNALCLTHPGDVVEVAVNRSGITYRYKVELVERTTELLNKAIN